MSNTTKPFGSKRDAECEGRQPGALNGAELRDRDASVAAIVERDEERRIQGVDLHHDGEESLDDDASEAEEDDELEEDETVDEEAKANQR
jgi:hypothetical protein